MDDFRTTPPDPDLKPDYSERFTWPATTALSSRKLQRIQAVDQPRLSPHPGGQDPTRHPFYDDSYAVNSANLGPYGDAIETELIPAIEKQFRGLPDGGLTCLWRLYRGWDRRGAAFYPRTTTARSSPALTRSTSTLT